MRRPREPFQPHDVDGEVDWPVGEFVRHLVACDYSAASCRSYLLSLLRWLRFLSAVSVAWDRAARRDVRDFVLWMRGADNPQRQRRGGVLAGSVNGVTGKPELSEGYAPATINHALSAVRMFYDYHQLSGEGPVVNPVPVQQGRDGGRALAHRSPIEPVERLRRAAYRQRVQVPTSPDALLWLALYLAETEQLRPTGDTRLWWTLRRPTRVLTYSALRQVLNRANAQLGSNGPITT